MDNTMRKVLRMVFAITFVLIVVAAFVTSKWILLSVLAFVDVFIMVYVTPEFKNHENLGVAAGVVIPAMLINLIPSFKIFKAFFFGNPLTAIMYAALVWFALLSVEEVLTGVLARLIWNKQKKLVMK